MSDVGSRKSGEAAGDVVRALPGLKEHELARLGPCVICGKPLLGEQRNELTFYRVRITRCAWDAGAVQRQAGLAMMLGGHGALARAMGPDEDLAKILDGPRDGVVHESCAARVNHVLELMPGEGGEGVA